MKKCLFIFIFFAAAQYLFANAGSPMVWFSFFHLIVINAIIGFSESWILKKMSITNKAGWIVSANYLSMFFGMYFIVPILTTYIGYNDFWGMNVSYGQYNLNGFFLGMCIAYISTLLIEFPFYYFGITREKRSKTIKGLVIANIITYLIMTSVYYIIVGGGGQF